MRFQSRWEHPGEKRENLVECGTKQTNEEKDKYGNCTGVSSVHASVNKHTEKGIEIEESIFDGGENKRREMQE